MRTRVRLGFVAALVLMAAQAQAISDADKCEAAKNKFAGKYAFCRQKAEAKAIKTGDPADYSKCDAKFGQKWMVTETKGGGMCPTNGDAGSIQTRITNDTDDLALLLSGGVLPGPAGCGNGVAETGESCDGSDLNGETCATLGYAAGAGLACTSECKLDSSACEAGLVPSRWRNNGDGTATDLVTGLMWERKTDDSSIHDKDNFYTWSNTGALFDGTAKTVFLDALNDVAGGGASCFTGHCDWRLATVLELQTILLASYPCATHPCIDPVFGPTLSNYYWSTTTLAGNPNGAWLVFFYDGNASNYNKPYNGYVRAVRGDL